MEMLPVRAENTPSAYEQQALRELYLWKNPSMGWFGKAVDGLNRKFRDVTDLISKVPGVDWTIENVVSGLLRLTNEMVQDSVWREAIYKEYHAAGHAIDSPDDLLNLDLEQIDGVMKGLDTKYRALTATQGAAAGYAGAAGILPDVLGLVALNLRACGEYATYCGYDISQSTERLFALQILNMVSQPTDTAKQAALVPSIKVSHAIARQQTLQTVEQMALTRAIRNAARALGVHLTQRKLAQVVPMTGAFVGGGFNAYYTSKVCDAAFFLYRERWLIEKYGPDVLTVED